MVSVVNCDLKRVLGFDSKLFNDPNDQYTQNPINLQFVQNFYILICIYSCFYTWIDIGIDAAAGLDQTALNFVLIAESSNKLTKQSFGCMLSQVEESKKYLSGRLRIKL